jgi:hypothetical protein
MSWFRLGPFVFLFLFLANYFFLVRPRRKEAATPQTKSAPRITILGGISILLAVSLIVAGIAAPQLAPGSDFGQFMKQDLAILYLAIWVWFFLTVLATVGDLTGFPLWERATSPDSRNPSQDT